MFKECINFFIHSFLLINIMVIYYEVLTIIQKDAILIDG